MPGPGLFIEGAGTSQIPSLAAKGETDLGIKFRQFLDQLNHLKYLNHIQFWIPDDLTEVEKERSKRYVEVVRAVIRDVRSTIGNREDSLLGMRNLFANLPTILAQPDLSAFQIPKPFDALVISAGPSLELEYENLRKLQNKVLLVSVDASLKALLREGITPHIVVATERDEGSLRFFENLPSPISTVFVGQPTVPPQMFDDFPGPKACVFKYTGPFLWLPMERAKFWAASSSSHLAYRVCTYLGASSVALVGQDLSFHPETLQSHSDLGVYEEWKNPESLEKRLRERNAFYVEGNTYDKVLTDPIWSLFAHDFEVLMKETNVPTTNTSRLGMKIAGSPYQGLSDWMKGKNSNFYFAVPSENPHGPMELHALIHKKSEALHHLEILSKMMRETKVLDRPQLLYQQLTSYPHFLELVMEVVFSDWIQTENELFGNALHDVKSQNESMCRFFSRCADDIDHVLEILQGIDDTDLVRALTSSHSKS